VSLTQGSESPSELVERVRVAINEHDLEALVRCFADDYVNETPVHPSRGFRGRDQVRKNWKQIFAGVPDITAGVIRVATDATTVWSEWELRGTRRDGSPFRMRGVAIYGVDEGLASWCRFYLEPVDEAGNDIDTATHDVVTGPSAQAPERDVSA